MSNQISPATVAHIAQLAQIPINAQQQQQLAADFSQTLTEVDKIMAVDVTNTPPTHQTSGLVNVWRADQIDHERMLTPESALSQAPHTWNGYVVVDRVIEE